MEFKFSTETKDWYTIESEIVSFGRTSYYTAKVTDEKLGSVTSSVQIRTNKESSKNTLSIGLSSSIDSQDIEAATNLIHATNALGDYALTLAEELRDPKVAYEKIIDALGSKNIKKAYMLWGLCPSLREEIDGVVLSAHLIQSNVYSDMITRGRETLLQGGELDESSTFVWESFNKLVGGALLELNSAKTAFELINHVNTLTITDIKSFHAIINSMMELYTN